MKSLRVSGIKLGLDENEACLKEKTAALLDLSVQSIGRFKIIRKAIDARRNRPPYFVYVVELDVPDDFKLACVPAGIQLQEPANKILKPDFPSSVLLKIPVVVAGSGPAGLFAAYVLARRGFPVLLLERGSPLERRRRDVREFWERGILNPASNVLFGEGGAGTFSDGKLTSRTKNPYSAWVKEILAEMGAPSAVLTEAKPHIGTDLLEKVVMNFRNKLLEIGCKIRFDAQVTEFVILKESLEAVIVNGKEEIKGRHLILAIGQSADDTYGKLRERGVRMEPKPFAMGVRVEHPQELINILQYGKWSGHRSLAPAEYFVTAAVPQLNRSIYTFCMCPGGTVIGCSASPGHVLINGMSNSRRSGSFANSAVVVNIRIDDFHLRNNPLSGLEFRSIWEKKAFTAGGADYCAPAQKMTDFLAKKKQGVPSPTSFRPGTKYCLLDDVLPDFVADSLRAGIAEFNKKMPGFVSPDAYLIGVETRTSSPVRISRRKDGQSETVSGIYPCGEGSGYAGGIISSALDGIRAAQNLINNLTGNGCRL